jgi:hypothetical protein
MQRHSKFAVLSYPRERAPPQWIFSDLSNRILSPSHNSMRLNNNALFRTCTNTSVCRPDPNVAWCSDGMQRAPLFGRKSPQRYLTAPCFASPTGTDDLREEHPGRLLAYLHVSNQHVDPRFSFEIQVLGPSSLFTQTLHRLLASDQCLRAPSLKVLYFGSASSSCADLISQE